MVYRLQIIIIMTTKKEPPPRVVRKTDDRDGAENDAPPPLRGPKRGRTTFFARFRRLSKRGGTIGEQTGEYMASVRVQNKKRT